MELSEFYKDKKEIIECYVKMHIEAGEPNYNSAKQNRLKKLKDVFEKENANIKEARKWVKTCKKRFEKH